jgi:hypothetical protein
LYVAFSGRFSVILRTQLAHWLSLGRADPTGNVANRCGVGLVGAAVVVVTTVVVVVELAVRHFCAEVL